MIDQECICEPSTAKCGTFSATHLADYSYLGRGGFVVTDYTEPQIKYTLVGTAGGNDPDTGDIYHGLDRFGRIKDSYWYNYGTSTDADRIKYGYDRVGNRLWRDNTVDPTDSYSEQYLYDEINRLQELERGELDSNHNIINETFAECCNPITLQDALHRALTNAGSLTRPATGATSVRTTTETARGI